MEIKDMLGYLRFASNPYDIASFDKIINVPERNIRKYTINRILDMNETFGGSMLDTIEIFLHDERRLFSGDRNELKNFLNLCHHIHRKIVAEV
jgi:superfamily I DNA/RNA helicase